MNARDRFVAFRRSLGRTPPLDRQVVRARGLSFAVFTSPPVAGQPPLLCVNGGMLYSHAMLWPALSPLAAQRQVILYDQRGRGESDAPPDPLAATIHDDAADVPALRRALGIRQWDVLGHSWGGGIAMLATAGDPAGVRRLVTVDAVGPRSSWMQPTRVNSRRAASEGDRATIDRITELALQDPDPQLHSDFSRASYPAWFVNPELAAFFTPPVALSPTGAAVLAELRRNGYDWRDRLRTLSTPTLVLHGEGDALPPSVSTEIAEVLPQARQRIVPDSGHMPFWEAPERFFSLVNAYLLAASPGAARLEA
ncbi:MAG: putative hydrolase [Gemmatimonadetes bacterium]|nr:putative hydrolase [Gemmatimonadota bacterium]